ncbi:9412_t:CDS:1, partial [Funneliformis caledonium]
IQNRFCIYWHEKVRWDDFPKHGTGVYIQVIWDLSSNQTTGKFALRCGQKRKDLIVLLIFQLHGCGQMNPKLHLVD